MSSYAREEEFQYMGLGWSVTWNQCTMHVSLPYERGLQYQVRVIGPCAISIGSPVSVRKYTGRLR